MDSNVFCKSNNRPPYDCNSFGVTCYWGGVGVEMTEQIVVLAGILAAGRLGEVSIGEL